MIIYAELLFIENLITGWVILTLTGRLRGCRPQKWRSIAGSVMCGLYAFILFAPLHWLTALASKLLFSAAVVVTVFGRSTWRSALKTTATFYITSFLMGGVTIALMYLLKIPGMTGNSSYVMKGATFLQIAAGVAATWYLGCWLSGLLREKALRQSIMHQVTVKVAGNEWHMNALIDTGNSLNDPVTGWPVAVLSKDASEKIKRQCDSEQFTRFSAIPFRTAGRPGVLFGLRPEAFTINGRNITEVVIGFSEKNFAPWRGAEKYDLLLHQQFLEGEEQNRE